MRSANLVDSPMSNHTNTKQTNETIKVKMENSKTTYTLTVKGQPKSYK